MRVVLPALLAALICAPALSAGDAPPPPPSSGDAQPQGDRGPGRDRGDWTKRIVENHPELQGVDLNTEEGKAKLQEAMQKRIRERMAEGQTNAHNELKQVFAMSDEEFAAIEPLISRVENLRLQRNLVDRAAIMGGMPGMGRGNRGGRTQQPGGQQPAQGGQQPAQGGTAGGSNRPSMFSPQGLLGDTELDPSVAELDKAVKALKALSDDAQANATELDLALTNLRKARAAYQEVLTKAQDELRSVLTRRQEVVLVERGTIE